VVGVPLYLADRQALFPIPIVRDITILRPDHIPLLSLRNSCLEALDYPWAAITTLTASLLLPTNLEHGRCFQPRHPRRALDPHFDSLSDEPVLIDKPAWDITTLSALGALRTLQDALETLTEVAADVPPTPPISRPATPTHNKSANENAPPQTYIGADADPHDIQHAAIARRFFSKRPPPFSISAYLSRQHAYCPHSPGVYLTAAHYIHRLCISERVLPVTNRTVHRLSLAAIRIAAKALEDNKWSQQRVAQVGGVSPTQLLNLEVALCFLLDFELGVDAEGLAKSMFGLQMAGRSNGR
jgi:hypothetical protein